jgi:hypothetical protein
MKKLLVILSAVALVAAFALPASAWGLDFYTNCNDNQNCNFDAACSQAQSESCSAPFACATAGYCGIPNCTTACNDIEMRQCNVNCGDVRYADGGKGGDGSDPCGFCSAKGGKGGEGNAAANNFDQNIKIEKATLTGFFTIGFQNGGFQNNQAGINSVAVVGNFKVGQ